jgi:diapolycopene oxygenase
VIGAGLGGLSAAISLATEGARVTLLEKNAQPGGKLNVLEKSGFKFDLGPSILTMPHVFEALFQKAGRPMSNYVQFQELKTHWRNFFEDGLVLDLVSDLREQERELQKLGPDGARGFFEFLEYSRSLCKVTERGYFEHGLDSFAELLRFYGPIQSLSAFDPVRSLDQGVRRFIKDPRLVDILNYFIKYVGSSPYDAPALLNLLPYVQFGYGLWYVKGGMHALAKALEQLLRDLGGEIRYGAEINQISVANGAVTGVELTEGQPISAELVVSNLEVIPTYQRLLRESKDFLRTLDKFEPSCSGYVMHLGVNRSYPQLAHHNVFYSKNARRHFDSIFKKKILSEDPTIYLVAPTKTDIALAPPGCEIIKVLPHIPHLEDQAPSESDYAAYRERVLVKLERMGLTDLRRHIVAEETWTPHDIERHYGSHRGSIYGVVSDRFKNLGFKAPQRSSKYRNLYFVGGSVNPGGGMPMVVLSGQLVCKKILQDQRS